MTDLSTALDKLLEQPTAVEPEHRARTEFDGVSGYIQTRPLDTPPADYDELLRTYGYDPAEVEITGPVRQSRWEVPYRDSDGELTTRWLTSYRITIVARSKTLALDELLDDIRRRKPRRPAAVTGTGVIVAQASDTQLGKIDGHGVEGTIERYFDYVDRSITEFKALRKRRSLGAAHLIFAGDCVEGNQSQSGRSMWRTQLTITEQVRVWRRMLLTTVQAWAPLVDELQVSVVGGNHDEAQRLPVTTRADDNWATEGAIAVHDALQENPAAYEHVTVQVPPVDQGYMTVQVADSISTILHGHQFHKGKAAEWWKSQAYYQGNPGGAHFMCHGHWHSTSVAQDGPRTIICSGTFEGGSAWYREKTGAWSRPGGLVYVTRGGELSDLSML
ncbi:Bacteriophage protein [Mycobacteroides abscessus subsp. abscessus]|nr:Bacteriophage protein [Mycobacteroides abscessus subsp. abscessus]